VRWWMGGMADGLDGCGKLSRVVGASAIAVTVDALGDKFHIMEK
jgi:hypothetical protein